MSMAPVTMECYILMVLDPCSLVTVMLTGLEVLMIGKAHQEDVSSWGTT